MISVFLGELGAFGTAAGETTVTPPVVWVPTTWYCGVLLLEHGLLVGERNSLGCPGRGASSCSIALICVWSWSSAVVRLFRATKVS